MIQILIGHIKLRLIRERIKRINPLVKELCEDVIESREMQREVMG